MSKRFPIIVLCAIFCTQSNSDPSPSTIGYRGRGQGRDVDLLPNVVRSWVAAAKHVAVTFGSRFIFTFDGRLYSLPKSMPPACRHTLMRDKSSDRVSTLIGNRNSLTIVTKQLTVSIDEDYQVKVNNTNLVRDLPLTSWDGRILISREASWVSVESLDGGFMIACSPLAKMCMVILSTSYQGDSLGLLGTNDGNPSNDFLLRNGRESDNMRNFINSFEVTGLAHCLSNNTEDNTTGRRHRAEDEEEEEVEENEETEDESAMQEQQQQEEEDERRSCERRYVSACKDLFNSQRSTLAHCYSKIDPAPFLSACLDTMDICRRLQRRRWTVGTDTDFCHLVLSYSLLCSLRPTGGDSSGANITSSSSSSSSRTYNASQILLRVPDGCRGCPSSSADVTQSLQPTRKKVDMVIVVSGLKSSNRTGGYRIGQALKHVLHEVRESLRIDYGVRDLRFGLVTHDDHMRPFSHTLKGLLFGTHHTHSLLESRLISLDTNLGSPSYLTAAAAAAEESIYTQYTTTDALKLALKYPLRTLAVKQLLLVTTSINPTDENDLQHIVQESLLRGIQLHLWSLSGIQSSSQASSLHRLVEATNGSVFHVTRTTRQSSGATYRISRHLIQQIVSRMRQCQRCSTNCSPLGILDDLHCQPTVDGPC